MEDYRSNYFYQDQWTIIPLEDNTTYSQHSMDEYQEHLNIFLSKYPDKQELSQEFFNDVEILCYARDGINPPIHPEYIYENYASFSDHVLSFHNNIHTFKELFRKNYYNSFKNSDFVRINFNKKKQDEERLHQNPNAQMIYNISGYNLEYKCS